MVYRKAGSPKGGLWADLETKFRIDKWLELSPYSSLRWVIIQLDEAEAGGNWKTGYYFSPLIKVSDVKKQLSLEPFGSLFRRNRRIASASEDDH
jgi:hypothetical protein